ncbi:MAG: (2Fe-2S)-binding protein [Burkholderiales bacterium]|nr:MAG: (2Fe-2S)-binding protein [Burkholderiales bacterium]
MPTVIFHPPGAEPRSVRADAGMSVMQAAVFNNVPGIDADCGGCMSCATCRIVIDPSWRERVGPPGADEAETLQAHDAAIEPGLRLGCQIELTDALDGLSVTIPSH